MATIEQRLKYSQFTSQELRDELFNLHQQLPSFFFVPVRRLLTLEQQRQLDQKKAEQERTLTALLDLSPYVTNSYKRFIKSQFRQDCTIGKDREQLSFPKGVSFSLLGLDDEFNLSIYDYETAKELERLAYRRFTEIRTMRSSGDILLAQEWPREYETKYNSSILVAA